LCFFRGDVPMGRPHQLLHVSEPRVLNVAAWLMSCMLLLQLRCCQADVMQYARLKELKMPSEQDKAGTVLFQGSMAILALVIK